MTKKMLPSPTPIMDLLRSQDFRSMSHPERVKALDEAFYQSQRVRQRHTHFVLRLLAKLMGKR